MQLFSSSAMQLGFNFHFKHPFILGKVRYSCFRTYLSSAKNYCVDNIKKKIQQRRQTVWQAHLVVEFPAQVVKINYRVRTTVTRSWILTIQKKTFLPLKNGVYKPQVIMARIRYTYLSIIGTYSPYCTEVRFASSGGFTTMALINPLERKLAKRISVYWSALDC